MRHFLFAASALVLADPAGATGPSVSGDTGLLVTPSAEVLAEGSLRLGGAEHDPRARSPDVQNYSVAIGLFEGLEIGGRLVNDNMRYDLATQTGSGIRDLSFNLKYRLELPHCIGIAIGAQDVGGNVPFYRTRYVVATVPWQTLALSAGYGTGPDVLEGAFGGLEWRPWPFLGLIAEHDTRDANAGLKLSSPALIYGLRLGATAFYRGAAEEVEYGAHLEIPLGRQRRHFPERTAAEVPVPPAVVREGRPLHAALTERGFESIRVGRRGATQVVGLENRVYNHSSADAVGVALAAIARNGDPDAERIELTLFSYGMPQVLVGVDAALYRAFLADPGGHADAVRASLAVRPTAGFQEAAGSVEWDSDRYEALRGPELIVEPLLRSFVGSEIGMLDYSVGAHLRVTTPLSRGFLLNLGGQVPVWETDDFRRDGNFSGYGVEAGFDQALLQYAHKLGGDWAWLWSAGRTQVYRASLNVLALEQLWQSGDGTHQLRSKLMALDGVRSTRTVALAGYTWFDHSGDYSLSLTAGRFYSEDAGVRVDLGRHFGDTIVTLFFKAASLDDQAGGLQLSLPLTPRRDATPRGLQVKGARRWSHTQATTLNAAVGGNPLRPLLLYEPMLDLDLRRDFYDAGRLGEAYLRDELPRLHEAGNVSFD